MSFTMHLTSKQSCTRVFFLPSFSSNFDGQSSPYFHRFLFYALLCWDTSSENTSLVFDNTKRLFFGIIFERFQLINVIPLKISLAWICISNWWQVRDHIDSWLQRQWLPNSGRATVCLNQDTAGKNCKWKTSLPFEKNESVVDFFSFISIFPLYDYIRTIIVMLDRQFSLHITRKARQKWVEDYL